MKTSNKSQIGSNNLPVNEEVSESLVLSMIKSARSYLLDTSLNNRMINSKISLSKGLSFTVEDLNSFYSMIIDHKSFSFLPLEKKKSNTNVIKAKEIEQTDIIPNKKYGKAGSCNAVSILDSNNNETIVSMAFKLKEGEGELTHKGNNPSELMELIDSGFKFIKKNFQKYGIDLDKIYNYDIQFQGIRKNINNHISSIGLSSFIAIISLLRDEAVPSDIIFSASIGQNGEVIKVDNIIDKCLFAHKNGYRKIFVSKKNKKDLKLLPKEVSDELEIVYIENVEEVILAVFDMFNVIDESVNDYSYEITHKNSDKIIFYVNYNRDDLKERLEKISYNTKNHIEEQGINILFCSFGFLQWNTKECEDELINSPLIFVPVNIETGSFKNTYKLSYSNSEIIINKSLIKKLELENNIDFGDLRIDITDESKFDVSEYLNQFFDIVKGSGYDFGLDMNTVHLSFYSYNKFLMYNDLDPENWETVKNANTGENVLNDIFVKNIYHEVSNVDDDKLIDGVYEIDSIKNIVDADSSQLLAISKVNRGNSIIIQGPPGTGKSQTIVNIIAEAVRQNKKVLFMSEKLAAMEVVKNRLRTLNLDHIALELHSDKSNKKTIVKDLESVYYMNKKNIRDTERGLEKKLKKLRTEINEYYELLHTSISNSKLSIIDCYQEILKFEDYFDNNDVNYFDLHIPNEFLKNFSDSEFERVFNDMEILEKFFNKYGSGNKNSLRGVELEHSITNHELNRYLDRVEKLLIEIDKLIETFNDDKLSDSFKERINIKRIKLSMYVVSKTKELTKSINNLDFNTLYKNQEILSKLFKHYQVIKDGNDKVLNTYLEKNLDQAVLNYESKNLSLEIEKLESYHSSIVRMFSKKYRIFKEELIKKYTSSESMSYKNLLKVCRWLKEYISYKEIIFGNDEEFTKIFGNEYNGENSDFNHLYCIYTQTQNIITELTKIFNSNKIKKEEYLIYFKILNDSNIENITTVDSLINELYSSLKINEQIFYNIKEDRNYEYLSFDQIKGRFNNFKEYLPALNDIMVLRKMLLKSNEYLKDEYLIEVVGNDLYQMHLSKIFKYIRYHSIIDKILEEYRTLDGFNAMVFDQKIREFIKLDTKQIQVNNLQSVLDSHFMNVYNCRKNETLSKEKKDEQIAYLLRTFNMKRNIPSVKRLIKEAWTPITMLKPVFMMSPISISQYLDPISGLFDLVVFDEASQIKPQDAFGAMLRGKQIVIVGDEKQLPPTNFFESFYGNIGAFDEEALANYESILTLLRGAGIPTTSLYWHYRSKHHDLIKVSNDYFYDKNLSVFPSLHKNSPDYGLKYVFVNGIFDRGRSRTNIVEAKVIAEAIMEHATNNSEASLGVATLNTNQRDLILSELKKMRRKDKSSEKFFREDGTEPFFIKNLENVQGDEREVIFISIGYAKDVNGNLIQNFGAINHQGGERRLNVLMTRARQKCVIFTGIRHSDLEVDDRSAEGLKVLQRFLRFAEENNEVVKSNDEETSVFSKEIACILEEKGYRCDYHIGNSGYFIDLAVVDPDDETKYLLGIEFDNSLYNSSRSASERERIRNNVMRNKGWKIYKIYLPSWFNNRQKEVNDLVEFLEYLKSGDYKPESTETEIEFYDEPINVITRFQFAPYKKFNSTIENVHYLAKDINEFKNYLKDLIYEETPINYKTIVNRIISNSLIDVKSYSISGKVKKALKKLIDEQVVYIKEGFYYFYKKDTTVSFRDRRIMNKHEIDLSNIANDEFVYAIKSIVNESFGTNIEDITTIISNYLGYQGANESVHNIIKKNIIRLTSKKEMVIDDNGNLHFKGQFKHF